MSGLLYLSPAPTFWRIVKRRSTEEFESIPYIAKLLNAYFWVYYGLIKPDSLLVATVNMFGGVVEIIFLTLFLLFAPPRMKVCFLIYLFSLPMNEFKVLLLIFFFSYSLS
jgi:solute carrier family 50 protein (sugar transporter)